MKENIILNLIRQGYTPDEAINYLESFPFEAEQKVEQRNKEIKRYVKPIQNHRKEFQTFSRKNG